MTTWILDVSQFQKGLDLASVKRQGYSAVIAKCTEGHGYADSQYKVFKWAAQRAGLFFGTYHFLHSDSSPSAQAANLARNIVDKSIPVWIDCEESGSSKPSIAQADAFKVECRKLGLKVAGIYDPNWYWTLTGRAKLPSDLAFWQSGYPNDGKNTWDFGSVLYPGDKHKTWNKAQGGRTPDLWQFTSSGKLSGYTAGKVDISAFRGTVAQLAETGWFKTWESVPRPPAPRPPVPPVPPPPPVPPTPTTTTVVSLSDETITKIAETVRARFKGTA